MAATDDIFEVTREGRALRVERIAPPRNGPHPVVILLHGADGLGRGRGYRTAAHTLASAGYAVFLPHYLDRTGETAATFSAVGANFPVWLDALRGVLAAIAGREEVDAARIGLVGVSLGAALGLALAAEDRRIAALVDYFGFVPPRLDERPALSLPPTLILHGARDAIVPVANAHALDALLSRLGTARELVVYPDQAHGFSGAAEADAALRVAAFLRRHLR